MIYAMITLQIMAKRQPLESKVLLLVYNFSMVALNFYIFVEVRLQFEFSLVNYLVPTRNIISQFSPL